MIYDLETCKRIIVEKYPHFKDKDSDLELIYNMGVETFINLRFPFDLEITEIPEKEFAKHPTWVYRFMLWYIKWAGISNLVGYSENGISWKFDKAGIPQELIDELIPCAS